jgi:hydrogenase expression/formation protein HypD
MKHIDEYRSHELSKRLLDKIKGAISRPWRLMEVCGGQTHAILRHGIDEALEGYIQLLHGPGCPVCVTPESAIDQMVELSRSEGFIVVSFGDMLRVPGTRESLLQSKSNGADVRIVYSPLDILKIARAHPKNEIVFFAVGFETTAPATAITLQQAAALSLRNVSMLAAHVRVLPAMEFIANSPESQVDGFLGAGHVCTITGYEAYQKLVDQYSLPIAITGFEPVDLLRGILKCVQMLERGQPEVANVYERSVRVEGNVAAMDCFNDVYEVADSPWRGLGNITAGGLSLKSKYERFCAKQKFSLPIVNKSCHQECRSGDVMTGKIRPPECPHFGVSCTPDHPIGAPMVSSEGACSAYFRYRMERESQRT